MFGKSFTRSLQKLDQNHQAAAKQTVTDYLLNPEAPGLNVEPVQGAHGKDFYSARVNDEVRLIFYKKGRRVLFLHADRHDRAYEWARRHELSENARTGAPQLVNLDLEEVRRKVRIPTYEYVVEEPRLFASRSDDYLLDLGVPPDLLSVVKEVTRSSLIDLIDFLPEEVSERLIRLADGELVVPPGKPDLTDPFEHPDASRRFRDVTDVEELERALSYPWEQWLVFLHPAQREIVERTYSGSARVTGAAGTGKTVVALHRTARLHGGTAASRILLTTFSKALAARLSPKLELLLGDQELWSDRITVANLHKIARREYVSRTGHDFQRVNDDELDEIIKAAAARVPDLKVSLKFLRAEWDAIVDALGISAWTDYRKVARVGRGTPLGAKERRDIWTVFEAVLAELRERGRMTFAMLSHAVVTLLEESDDRPFDHVVVDEAQDFGPAELRLCRALAPVGEDDLFLAGDEGQRIYRGKYSWLSQGVDVRGRSACLRVNYRTTEQIRKFADALAASDNPTNADAEDRTSYSVFTGVAPRIYVEDGPAAEAARVGELIEDLIQRGFDPEHIAVFARTRRLAQQRVKRCLEKLSLESESLRPDAEPSGDRLSVGTMHSAKGLEFRAVILVACDMGVLPLDAALEQATDAAEMNDAIEKERNLLYVASTRAREELFITSSGTLTTFLADHDVGREA